MIYFVVSGQYSYAIIYIKSHFWNLSEKGVKTTQCFFSTLWPFKSANSSYVYPTRTTMSRLEYSFITVSRTTIHCKLQLTDSELVTSASPVFTTDSYPYCSISSIRPWYPDFQVPLHPGAWASGVNSHIKKLFHQIQTQLSNS